jgi:hypothetical protein
LVSVDLAEIRHTPRPPASGQAGDAAPLTAKIAALQTEIARLQGEAAGHRADFEHERERGDRLMVELLQATAETMATKEALARLEGSLRSGGRTGVSIDGHGQVARRLGHLAADLVEADRKANR